jgi:hypothetical protein
MMTRFRLTLLCLGILCLLLSLTQPAEFDHRLPIVGSESWFARHLESATDAPTVSVVRSLQSPARAGPRQSLVFRCTLTMVNTGPPDWGRHGPPPAIAVLASCRSGGNPGNSKTNALEHHSPQEFWLKPPISKIRGFATAFS